VTIPPAIIERLRFLTRVVTKETQLLSTTSERLFLVPFTPERIAELNQDPDLAERVDAFVSRFGRLQDTLGDKLLPLLLSALGESPAPTIDRLDLAERLGFIASSEQWMRIRRLRNQMVQEYVEDPQVLADALQGAHQAVATLVGAGQAMTAEIERRGWQ
jgi:hypothetical protein